MNIRVGELSGSDATDRLRETVEKFNQEASRQTQKMIILTWVIAGLTAVLFVGLCVQIWLDLSRHAA